MTLNAQSLNSKMYELKKMVRLTKPHIIGITETWGKEKINYAYFKIDNYTMYRNDRIGRRGGGRNNTIHHKSARAKGLQDFK